MVVCKNVGRFEVWELMFVEGFGFFRRGRCSRRWRPRGRGRGVLGLGGRHLLCTCHLKPKQKTEQILS
jgi:hypothetical protein